MTAAAIEYILCDVGTVRRACAEHSWLDSVLSSDEIDRSNRFRRADDRAGYRCGHLVFRLMAARSLGLEPSNAGELRFTRTCRSCGGPHGKPQIAGEDAGAELSMSRSGDMLLVASAPPSSPIGVDVERIPAEVFTGFDDYALAPTESVPHGGDAVRRRLELWVAKEAAVKTTGHGLAVAPNKLEVVRAAAATSPAHSAAQWTASISAAAYSDLNQLNIASVPCRPGYSAALSCPGAPRISSLNLSDLLAG